MATQRLNPINIDYQTPTDVAGFAGQRAAVQEFEVTSKNQTAKISEAQSVVSQHLKAQETFARIGQTQQELQLATAKQVHNQRMQNEELNMMKRKLPFELAQMDADLEAQRIDNAYADEDNASRLRGQHLQNRIREEDLDRYKRSQQEIGQAGNWRTNVQNQLNSGVDPDDIDWNAVTGGAPPTTKEGRESLEGIKEWARETTRGKMNDAANAKGLAALGNLSDAQRENLEKNVPNSFDANGVLTDVGRSAAKRFSATNKMGGRDRAEIEEELKRSLLTTGMPSRASILTGSRMSGPAPYKLAEYIDGQLVLTDEGVREVAARDKLREEIFLVEKKVVTDDGTGVPTTVTTYTPRNKVLTEKWETLNKQWRDDPNNEGKRLSSAQANAHYDEAQRNMSDTRVTFSNGRFQYTERQLSDARKNGLRLWWADSTGKYNWVTPDQLDGGKKATDDKKKPEETAGEAPSALKWTAADGQKPAYGHLNESEQQEIYATLTKDGGATDADAKLMLQLGAQDSTEGTTWFHWASEDRDDYDPDMAFYVLAKQSAKHYEHLLSTGTTSLGSDLGDKYGPAIITDADVASINRGNFPAIEISSLQGGVIGRKVIWSPENKIAARKFAKEYVDLAPRAKRMRKVYEKLKAAGK